MLSINKIEKDSANHFLVSARLNDGTQNKSIKLIATQNRKKQEIGKLFFKKNKAKCNLNNIDLLEKGSYKIDAITSTGNIIDVSFLQTGDFSVLHGSTNLIKINKEQSSIEVTPISSLTSRILVLSIDDDEKNLYLKLSNKLPSVYSIKCLTARHRVNNIEADSLAIQHDDQDTYLATFPKSKSFDKSGIWDFYVKVESNGVDSFVRLNAKNEVLSLQKINSFHEDKLFKFQPYITQDGQVSLNVRDLTTTFSKQESIFYKNNNFLINCKVNETYLGLYKHLKAKLVIDDDNFKMASVKSVKHGGLEFSLPFEWFQDLIKSSRKMAELYWEITLKNGDIHNLPVSHMLDEEHVKSSDVLIYPPANFDNKDISIQIKPFFNTAHKLLFSVERECECKINKITIGKKIEVQIDSPLVDDDVNIIAISGKDGSTISFEKKQNKFISLLDVKHISKNENAYFIHYVKNNENHLINDTSPRLRADFKTFKKNKVSLGDGIYASCVVCKKNLTSIEIRPLREHEKNTSKLSLFMAKLTATAIKKAFSKDVWLVGENLGDVAQDNGFAFFKHALELKNEHVYYVIRKNSIHYNKLTPFKSNTIIYDSFKHKVLYHLANKLVVAHGIRDVLPSIKHPVIYRNDKDIVYLQHGILAMKRIGMSGSSYNNKITKFVVSSESEKRIMMRESKFRSDQIIVSGLPRFDDLYKYETKPKRQIFIMPTWRDWLVDSEQSFIESDFYKNYKRLLSDKDLNSFLIKNDYTVKILPHTEIYKKYITLFNSTCENILIADLAEDTVQKLITESAGMVTDYSSVAWDFLFMRKPTLFFQFDVSEYLTKRGAYVSFQSHLPGPISYSYDDFTTKLKDMVEKDCRFENRHLSKLKLFINNIDDSNCHRVYREITVPAERK